MTQRPTTINLRAETDMHTQRKHDATFTAIDVFITTSLAKKTFF